MVNQKDKLIIRGKWRITSQRPEYLSQADNTLWFKSICVCTGSKKSRVIALN